MLPTTSLNDVLVLPSQLTNRAGKYIHHFHVRAWPIKLHLQHYAFLYFSVRYRQNTFCLRSASERVRAGCPIYSYKPIYSSFDSFSSLSRDSPRSILTYITIGYIIIYICNINIHIRSELLPARVTLSVITYLSPASAGLQTALI